MGEEGPPQEKGNESEMVTGESRRPFWRRHRIPVLQREEIKGEWLEHQ